MTVVSWLQWSLLAATSVALGISGEMMARNRLSPAIGFAAGVLVAVLAVLGLPSLSIRLTARGALAVSAVLLVRFGLLDGSVTAEGQSLLVWLVAAVAVLVLCDRIGTEANAPLQQARPPVGVPPSRTLRTILVAAVVVVVFALLVSPFIVPRVGASTQTGRRASFDPSKPGRSLTATGRLDMTTRPDPTNDVVFTVDSNRATFWRGETFDRWDGSSWTRSNDVLTPLDPNGAITHDPADLGAFGNDTVVQRFHVRAQYDDIVYGAASVDRVQIDRTAVQHTDGTILTSPIGAGATYTVTSRRIPLTAARLRAAAPGPLPGSIRVLYAQMPVSTERVRRAALQATAGAKTTFDRILAIETWMGKRTQYSLTAPLAPRGVDVVDHFLFTSKRGWCEQIASSLVVLARINGIPARLVSGFVPGEQDPVTGSFTVRAKDAHAWAEVWFPSLGWVPFDPTANVPLAGADHTKGTWASWLVHHWVVIALIALSAFVVAGPVRLFLRRRLAGRRSARRPAGLATWAAAADRKLVALGARVARARSPGETAEAYAAALADRYGDPRLVEVGRAVDDALYAPQPPTPERWAEADALLAELANRPAPEPEPVPA